MAPMAQLICLTDTRWYGFDGSYSALEAGGFKSIQQFKTLIQKDLAAHPTGNKPRVLFEGPSMSKEPGHPLFEEWIKCRVAFCPPLQDNYRLPNPYSNAFSTLVLHIPGEWPRPPETPLQRSLGSKVQFECSPGYRYQDQDPEKAKACSLTCMRLQSGALDAKACRWESIEVACPGVSTVACVPARCPDLSFSTSAVTLWDTWNPDRFRFIDGHDGISLLDYVYPYFYFLENILQ